MIRDILLIIWLHIIGDFVLQTRYIGNNKSKKIMILTLHCLLYSIPFFIISVEFAFINGLLHFPVDFITSRLTKYFYYKKQSEYLFFTTIGVGQAVHLTFLILTLTYS